ncbi:MAG: transglycosylase SLT domain-containing protein [Deltaproteobacteria bacterium]|nr:transglycosylase SLT domain-containing protein [Deltaproteobacteria bacterium]
MGRSLFLKFVIIAIAIFLTVQVAYAEEFPKVTSKKWTSKYDVYFKKYTKRYFGPGFDWKWFKAQAIAESNLNHRAESWVKAKGIMQILPKTFSEIKKKNPSFMDINEPRWNIAAGIYYDRQLYKKWKAPRPFNDRMAFTFGSYNAGFKTILEAQEECKTTGLDENLWANIREVAPKVRKWRHRETLGYVERINNMMY